MSPTELRECRERLGMGRAEFAWALGLPVAEVDRHGFAGWVSAGGATPSVPGELAMAVACLLVAEGGRARARPLAVASD